MSECGFACIKEPMLCWSFNYNKQAKVCELNTKRITNMTELSPKSEFRYFGKA